MSTRTRNELQEIIDEFHREAARQIALAVESAERWPWRRHDVRIYKERAQENLQAAAHLMEAL